MQIKIGIWHIVAVVVLIGGIIGIATAPKSAPSPGMPAAPVVPAVANIPPHLQSFADQIAVKLTGQPDKAAAISALYTALADAIERDAGAKVKTTAVLGEVVRRAAEVQITSQGGAMIGPAVAAKIGENAGIADPKGGYLVVEIDATKRAKIVEVLRAVAVASSGVK